MSKLQRRLMIAGIIIVMALIPALYVAYNMSVFNSAESKNHTSNRINVSFENIQEKSALEVLQVSDSYLKIEETESQKNSQRWVEIPGSAVFTVDLNSCQTVVDSENSYVRLILKEPELCNIKIEYDKCKVYNYEYNGKAKYDNYSTGTEEAKDDIAEAYKNLKDRFYSDQMLYVSAKNSAEKLLVAIIENSNLGTDVDVDVEWISAVGESE